MMAKMSAAVIPGMSCWVEALHAHVEELLQEGSVGLFALLGVEVDRRDFRFPGAPRWRMSGL